MESEIVITVLGILLVELLRIEYKLGRIEQKLLQLCKEINSRNTNEKTVK